MPFARTANRSPVGLVSPSEFFSLPLDGRPCWPVSPRKGFSKTERRLLEYANGVPLGSNVAMPDLGRHQSTDSSSSLVAKDLPTTPKRHRLLGAVRARSGSWAATGLGIDSSW